jgi:hypothetical protein
VAAKLGSEVAALVHDVLAVRHAPDRVALYDEPSSRYGARACACVRACVCVRVCVCVCVCLLRLCLVRLQHVHRVGRVEGCVGRLTAVHCVGVCCCQPA